MTKINLQLLRKRWHHEKRFYDGKHFSLRYFNGPSSRATPSVNSSRPVWRFSRLLVAFVVFVSSSLGDNPIMSLSNAQHKLLSFQRLPSIKSSWLIFMKCKFYCDEIINQRYKYTRPQIVSAITNPSGLRNHLRNSRQLPAKLWVRYIRPSILNDKFAV